MPATLRQLQDERKIIKFYRFGASCIRDFAVNPPLFFAACPRISCWTFRPACRSPREPTTPWATLPTPSPASLPRPRSPNVRWGQSVIRQGLWVENCQLLVTYQVSPQAGCGREDLKHRKYTPQKKETHLFNSLTFCITQQWGTGKLPVHWRHCSFLPLLLSTLLTISELPNMDYVAFIKWTQNGILSLVGFYLNHTSGCL